MAVTTITLVDELAYLLTCLPFGASAGPIKYSKFSEAFFGLIYNLLLDKSWNPKSLSALNPSEFLPDRSKSTTKYAPAQKLIFPFPHNAVYADGCIDDGILIGVDKDNNALRLIQAGPLIVDTIARPCDGHNDQNRDPPLAPKKLRAELTPAESKVVLGWLFNTSNLHIYLPRNKFLEWKNDIEKLLRTKLVTAETLDTAIGRLNHAGYIIPMGRYFLNRLRYCNMKCMEWGHQKLATWDIADLTLWVEILELVSQNGISLNDVNYTMPTDVGVTDTCKHGIGGFHAEGVA